MSYGPVLLVTVLLLSCPAFAWGNEFRIIPSISVKEEYNSNILLSADGARRDFITSISPGVEMVNRTDRLDTDLLIRLDRLNYADNRDISATNQTYNGKFRYLAAPLLSISAEAGYMRNTNPTLDIGTTGIVMAAVPWNRITSSLSADYQFTENTAAAVSYGYGRDYYENPGLPDDMSHDVNAGLVYDFGEYFPAVKGRLDAGYSNYDFSDSRIDSVMGSVGFSWDINEVWSVLVDSGIRRTWSEVSSTQLKNDGWGWVEKVSLDYKGERGNGDLAYTRDITPAYGLNGAAERNALTLSTRYRLTYELSALFTAAYYSLKSVSEFSAEAVDQRTLRVNPGVRYEFSKDTAVEASYEYTMVDYPASNTGANRHLFSVRLYIQHPFLD